MTTQAITDRIELTKLDKMKLFRAHSLIRIINKNKNSTREDADVKNRIQRSYDSLQALDKGHFRARATLVALKLRISRLIRHEFYFQALEFLIEHQDTIRTSDSPQKTYDTLMENMKKENMKKK